MIWNKRHSNTNDYPLSQPRLAKEHLKNQVPNRYLKTQFHTPLPVTTYKNPFTALSLLLYSNTPPPPSPSLAYIIGWVCTCPCLTTGGLFSVGGKFDHFQTACLSMVGNNNFLAKDARKIKCLLRKP